MPLHLLGKKSWNVYNRENIARVRRDEAEAKAREEAAERHMQEVNAEWRIKALRSQVSSASFIPSSLAQEEYASEERSKRRDDSEAGRHRKHRRLAEEDDTDRDIRLAREDAAQTAAKREKKTLSFGDDAPLLDSTGHFNLFSLEATAQKNSEAERELADKKRSYEDQYTMRFSNAAGFSQSAGQNPWYSSANEVTTSGSMSTRNIWGNEDPMRKEREMARIHANDPLAAMKKGVRQLKSVERERREWIDERSRELEELKSSQKRESQRKLRRRSMSQASGTESSYEGFNLDASPRKHRKDEHQEVTSSGRHRRRRENRDRQGSRSHRDRRPYSQSRRHHHAGYDTRRDTRSARPPGV